MPPLQGFRWSPLVARLLGAQAKPNLPEAGEWGRRLPAAEPVSKIGQISIEELSGHGLRQHDLMLSWEQGSSELRNSSLRQPEEQNPSTSGAAAPRVTHCPPRPRLQPPAHPTPTDTWSNTPPSLSSRRTGGAFPRASGSGLRDEWLAAPRAMAAAPAAAYSTKARAGKGGKRGASRAGDEARSRRPKDPLPSHTPRPAEGHGIPPPGAGAAAYGGGEGDGGSAGGGGQGEESDELSVPVLETLAAEAEKEFGLDNKFTAGVNLKLAQAYLRAGFEAEQVYDHADKAWKFFEANSEEDDLVRAMCLHMLAVAAGRLDRPGEALGHLRAALRVPRGERGPDDRMLAFSTHMLLGDTWGQLSSPLEALEAYRTALDLQERELGEGDPRTGPTLRQVAEALAVLTRFQEAEPFALRALRLSSAVEGPAYNPLEEAIDRRLLAALYTGMEDPQRALSQLEAVRSLLGERREGIDAAVVDVEIAEALTRMGKFPEALAVYEGAVGALRAALGEDSALVAVTYVAAGGAYAKAGREEEAEALCRKARGILEALPEEESQDAAVGLAELAGVYEARGRPEEALALFRAAAAAAARVPGQLFAVAGAESQAGCLLLGLRRPEEALAAFESARPKLEQALGPADPALARLQLYVGLAHAELGAGGAAVAALERAAAVLRAAGGESLPENVDIFESLADMYEDLGRHSDALPCREHVAAVKAAALGGDHPEARAAESALEEARERAL